MALDVLNAAFDLVLMFDAAWKATGEEELGAQAFMAHVKVRWPFSHFVLLPLRSSSFRSSTTMSGSLCPAGRLCSAFVRRASLFVEHAGRVLSSE